MDETTTDSLGSYTTRWECDVPPWPTAFRVLEQEWQDDYKVRVIRKIELVTNVLEQARVPGTALVAVRLLLHPRLSSVAVSERADNAPRVSVAHLRDNHPRVHDVYSVAEVEDPLKWTGWK